jgi:putative ABC transport system permease protein
MDTYNFQFLAGRNFTKDILSDNASVVINEASLQKLQFKNPDDAIGNKLWGHYTIIGVVKNHRHLYFAKDYFPFVYFHDPNRFVYFSIKYFGKNESEVIPFLENKWKSFFPEAPIEYFFQDEFYNRQYKDDNSFGRIFGLSALMAIILSYIGIYGLAYFDIIMRTKEIGIRKVLGASVIDLMATLSKGTIKLLVISNLIAWPIAYYIMSNWLTNYTARIGMPIWVYIVCCLMTFLVVLATISFQFLKIVKRNPVHALRTE